MSQPTRSGTVREPRQFDRTQLHEDFHGKFVHRDYAAHYFRWGFVARHVRAGSRILDIGCGQDLPLPHILAANVAMVPDYYLGVDLNRIKLQFGRAWATVWDEFEFTSTEAQARLGDFTQSRGAPNIVTCFEVIEHMGVDDGAKLLAGVRSTIAPDGVFYLSTPVFNGKAARNHIHEYTIPELQAAIEAAGFTVSKRYGTFMNYHDCKRNMAVYPEAWALYERVREFYSDDVMANFLAPLFPDSARNNLWVLKPLIV